jgi:hypothetical protein
MKIEAVTVCVDYSHYLKKTLMNKDKLDRWIVVTHESDTDTIKLCVDNNIEFVCSQTIFKSAKFAKGKAINEGLKKLTKTDWILHLDADQVLPANFREVVTRDCISKRKLYGAYRYTESGKKFPATKILSIVRKPDGTTVRKLHHLYIPIGYFQLWHSSKYKRYESSSKNTLMDDYKFILRWKSKKMNSSQFKKLLCMLDIKTVDVCGFEGTHRGHSNGVRNLSDNKK